MRIDKLLTGIGKTLISAGVLVFLFVAYQLWGTGLSEQRAQKRLQQEAIARFEQQATTTTTAKKGTPTTPTTAPPAPLTGSAIAIIRIPKIGVEKAVVSGTGIEDLKKGPGHYLDTALPGQKGNVGIAGHRTTYGAPFFNISELESGDDIQVQTRSGIYDYKVNGQQIVLPTNVSVLSQDGPDRLTLTTCHPRYSDRQRLIVTAAFVGNDNQLKPPPVTPETPQEEAQEPPPAVNHGDGSEAKGPAIVWGAVCVAFAIILWVMARRGPKLIVYLIGAPAFFVFLFLFFENFARLLPSSA